LGVGGCSWRSPSQIFNVHEHNIPARSAKVFFGSGFCGLIRAGKVQPGLIGIEDEDAAIIERDFFGLPGGFVALEGVFPVEGRFIVIGGDSLFDACQGGSLERRYPAAARR
jgi:hypothetical protein